MCRRPGRRSAAAEIAALAGRPYAEAAKRVLRPLIDGDIAGPDLDRMIDDVLRRPSAIRRSAR